MRLLFDHVVRQQYTAPPRCSNEKPTTQNTAKKGVRINGPGNKKTPAASWGLYIWVEMGGVEPPSRTLDRVHPTRVVGI